MIARLLRVKAEEYSFVTVPVLGGRQTVTAYLFDVNHLFIHCKIKQMTTPQRVSSLIPRTRVYIFSVLFEAWAISFSQLQHGCTLPRKVEMVFV